MTIDDKIRDKKHDMILTQKQKNNQHYHQGKLIIINKSQYIGLPGALSGPSLKISYIFS